MSLSRCVTGHARACPDVSFRLGFTNEECHLLASRQRATNYLLYRYTERGEPVREERKTLPRTNSSKSSTWRTTSATELETRSQLHKALQNETLGRKEVGLNSTNKRLSASLQRKSAVKRGATHRRASCLEGDEPSTGDSSAQIIIRTLNRGLSESEQLERYLVSLQKAGFLTCARNENRRDYHRELDRGNTPKGQITLRSKFPPHPPVYLFERAVKSSPFSSRRTTVTRP